MRSLTALVATSLVLSLCGCGEENPPFTPVPDGSVPTADNAVPGADQAPPQKACDCTAEQICDTDGQCITPPTPATNQGYVELILLRQHAPMTTGVLSALGKAEATFNIWAPLPQDNRTHYTTWDGGDCALEADTIYPYWYNDQSWPPDDGLGAGKLTFKPQGAPAPGLIELDPLDLDPGWAYFHGDVPPPLKEGYGTYSDFFDPAFVPFGQPYQVEIAGGPDVGPMTLSGAETAQDFTITQPAAEAPGATATQNAPLTITWSPAQEGATMEIFITQSFGMGALLLTCTVRDDGETTIPAPAVNNFIGEVGLQLRRTVTRYTQAQLGSGQPMHVYLMGRHARLGRVTLE